MDTSDQGFLYGILILIVFHESVLTDQMIFGKGSNVSGQRPIGRAKNLNWTACVNATCESQKF